MSPLVVRKLALLALVPSAPMSVTAHALAAALSDRGMPTTPRTVQRDLVELAEYLPLVARAQTRPFGWSWAPGSACACCGASR